MLFPRSDATLLEFPMKSKMVDYEIADFLLKNKIMIQIHQTEENDLQILLSNVAREPYSLTLGTALVKLCMLEVIDIAKDT